MSFQRILLNIFYSSRVLVACNAHSVRAVIDYVTVYRAHSSSDKEEGCDIPFRTVPLYAPLQADNSVTGGCPPHFVLWILKSVSVCRTKRGNETRADVFTMAGMFWHSARTSLPNALSSMQLRSRTYVATVVVARTSRNNIRFEQASGYIEFSRTFSYSFLVVRKLK